MDLILHHGPLKRWVNFHKGYQQRWMILRNDSISIYKNQHSTSEKDRKHLIPLNNSKIICEETCCRFSVETDSGKETFYFEANNVNELTGWFEAFTKCAGIQKSSVVVTHLEASLFFPRCSDNHELELIQKKELEFLEKFSKLDQDDSTSIKDLVTGIKEEKLANTFKIFKTLPQIQDSVDDGTMQVNVMLHEMQLLIDNAIGHYKTSITNEMTINQSELNKALPTLSRILQMFKNENNLFEHSLTTSPYLVEFANLYGILMVVRILLDPDAQMLEMEQEIKNLIDYLQKYGDSAICKRLEAVSEENTLAAKVSSATILKLNEFVPGTISSYINNKNISLPTGKVIDKMYPCPTNSYREVIVSTSDFDLFRSYTSELKQIYSNYFGLTIKALEKLNVLSTEGVQEKVEQDKGMMPGNSGKENFSQSQHKINSRSSSLPNKNDASLSDQWAKRFSISSAVETAGFLHNPFATQMEAHISGSASTRDGVWIPSRPTSLNMRPTSIPMPMPQMYLFEQDFINVDPAATNGGIRNQSASYAPSSPSPPYPTPIFQAGFRTNLYEPKTSLTPDYDDPINSPTSPFGSKTMSGNSFDSTDSHTEPTSPMLRKLNHSQLSKIRDILLKDPIILRDWVELKNDFLSSEEDKYEIEQIKEKSKIGVTIQCTLERWLSRNKQEFGNLDQIIKILEKRELNNICDKLKERSASIFEIVEA